MTRAFKSRLSWFQPSAHRRAPPFQEGPSPTLFAGRPVSLSCIPLTFALPSFPIFVELPPCVRILLQSNCIAYVLLPLTDRRECRHRWLSIVHTSRDPVHFSWLKLALHHCNGRVDGDGGECKKVLATKNAVGASSLEWVPCSDCGQKVFV